MSARPHLRLHRRSPSLLDADRRHARNGPCRRDHAQRIRHWLVHMATGHSTQVWAWGPLPLGLAGGWAVPCGGNHHSPLAAGRTPLADPRLAGRRLGRQTRVGRRWPTVVGCLSAAQRHGLPVVGRPPSVVRRQRDAVRWTPSVARPCRTSSAAYRRRDVVGHTSSAACPWSHAVGGQAPAGRHPRDDGWMPLAARHRLLATGRGRRLLAIVRHGPHAVGCLWAGCHQPSVADGMPLTRRPRPPDPRPNAACRPTRPKRLPRRNTVSRPPRPAHSVRQAPAIRPSSSPHLRARLIPCACPPTSQAGEMGWDSPGGGSSAVFLIGWSVMFVPGRVGR